MKKIIAYLYFCLLFAVACKEEIPGTLIKGGSKPDQVTNVSVENRPGGAKLSYAVPDNEDLLYVKAIFEYPEGNEREVRASLYVDTLVIEGIGDTRERTVKLIAVSQSEQASEPVDVTIRPLTPPVRSIGHSLLATGDFGGIAVRYENELTYDIVIEVLKKDNGGWNLIESHYSNNAKGIFSVRGQEAVPTTFGLYVRDRWNNKSDTVIVDLEPLYEAELAPPTPINVLPGDYNLFFGGYHYGFMFDGVISGANFVATLLTETSLLPLSFTLDFGKPTKFSRFKYWMRQHDTDGLYNYASPEKWELWGTNELADDWNQWTKIMDCTAEKPSGSLPGILTALDRETAAAGLDFDFPAGTPVYRYLRWRTMKTFGSLNAVQISELAFFGNDQ